MPRPGASGVPRLERDRLLVQWMAMDTRRLRRFFARMSAAGLRPLRLAAALLLVPLFAMQVMLAPAAHAAKADLPFAVWCAEKAGSAVPNDAGDDAGTGADACCMLGCAAAPFTGDAGRARFAVPVPVLASVAPVLPNDRDARFPPAVASEPRAPPRQGRS
jgi:hypothetical protein